MNEGSGATEQGANKNPVLIRDKGTRRIVPSKNAVLYHYYSWRAVCTRTRKEMAKRNEIQSKRAARETATGLCKAYMNCVSRNRREKSIMPVRGIEKQRNRLSRENDPRPGSFMRARNKMKKKKKEKKKGNRDPFS